MLLVLFYINFSQFAGLPLSLLFSCSKFYYLDFIGLQLWMLGPSVGSLSCRQFPVFPFFLVPPVILYAIQPTGGLPMDLLNVH